MTDQSAHPTQSSSDWLADVQPSAFKLDGRAIEGDGVIEAGFRFETTMARGRGHPQPHAVIVRGGQGGIVPGARLRRLGVPTLIHSQFLSPPLKARRVGLPTPVYALAPVHHQQ